MTTKRSRKYIAEKKDIHRLFNANTPSWSAVALRIYRAEINFMQYTLEPTYGQKLKEWSFKNNSIHSVEINAGTLMGKNYDGFVEPINVEHAPTH